MYLINRDIAIIRPKQSFLDWILSIEDDAGITLEELRNDATMGMKKNKFHYSD
ncbi:MAG: hypothetical protein HQM14_16460 [SAR324 cluster bacterium]|nr:hypothetical protein [SAR324 cluster bacterium]